MAAVFHGVDVSYAQGTVNWTSLAAAKDFAIIKASGGDDNNFYTDSQFSANQTHARATSMKIGYYHFGSNGLHDATSEADYFVSTIGTLQVGEAVFLDSETFTYNGTKYMPNDSWCYDFCAELKAQVGFTPAVYMNYSTANTGGGLEWPTLPSVARLWVAYWKISDTNYGLSLGAWGSYSPNYQWLQYDDSGSVSGISGPVDLDSFYAPTGNLSDWNNFAKPGTSGGGGTVGALTSANVTNPTMTYTQPAIQTLAVPVEKYDQVLFSTSYAAPTITRSSWPVNIAGPPTGLTQYAYPVGNYTYSVNGSASHLTDYGSINAGDFGQFPGNLPPVTVQPIVDSGGGLSFDVTVNGFSGSVSIDLVLNIALLAWPLTTSAPSNSVTQAIARSNAIANVQPSPYSTYRRIAADSSVGQNGTTVAHGQTTVPTLLYWVQDNSGTIEPQPVTWKSDGHATSFGISMDATNVYFYVDAANNAKCWYRIFKDN